MVSDEHKYISVFRNAEEWIKFIYYSQPDPYLACWTIFEEPTKI